MSGTDKTPPILLPACRQLLETHPESLRIREQVEALESAMPDHPGIVVSFCRTIIETACKTILTDCGVVIDSAWEAPKLVSETVKRLNLAPTDVGTTDARLRSGADSLVRGLNQIIQGVVEIRNAHGSAAHGADAYSPLLDERYAEIVARATDAVVGLLFKTHLSSAKRDPLARFQYGDHPDFDSSIDSDYGPFTVLEAEILASEALFRTDFRAYRQSLVQFKQEQAQIVDAAEGEVAPPIEVPRPDPAAAGGDAAGAPV